MMNDKNVALLRKAQKMIKGVTFFTPHGSRNPKPEKEWVIAELIDALKQAESTNNNNKSQFCECVKSQTCGWCKKPFPEVLALPSREEVAAYLCKYGCRCQTCQGISEEEWLDEADGFLTFLTGGKP